MAIVVTLARGGFGDLLTAVAAEVERHLGDHPTTAIDGMLVFNGDDGNVVVQEIAGSSPTQVVVYATSNNLATLSFRESEVIVGADR